MQNSLSCPPPGYHFCPTDEELICYYLKREVNGGLPAEAAALFKDYNIYDEEPWEIFKKFEGFESGDNGLYFFTILRNTKNMNRKIGNNGATWHGDQSEVVRTSGGAVVGMKRRFRYQNNQKPDHDGWIILQYDSECISENTVISQSRKKESKKRESMDHSEITEHDGIIQTCQRSRELPVIDSEPIRSQAQEPQQILQNQEMWLEAATVSMEDNGGCATEDSFINIEPAVQQEPNLANIIEEPASTENQQTEHEAGIVQREDNEVQAAEDIFDDLTDITNIEPSFQVGPDHQLHFIQESTVSENQQMALASFNNDHELVDELEAAFNGYDIDQIIQTFDKLIQNLPDKSGLWQRQW